MDYFNLKFHKTTIKNEIFAGIAMFMAMSYILVVNPTVLSEAGMDYNGVFLATVCVSGFATIVSAFYTKLPIALAPGLGLASIFSSLATGPDHVQWQVLLLATYVAGIVICGFVRFGVYDKIMEIMDDDFRGMIMSGIGLALCLYGISTTGLIQKQNGVYSYGRFDIVPVVICAISLLIIYLMKRWNKKGFVLIGLLVAYFMSICVNYYDAFKATGISVNEYLKEIFTFSYKVQDITKVMFTFPDVSDVFTDKQVIIQFFNAVFVFTMGHFFDAIGTNMSAFDVINSDIDARMKDTVSLKRVITVDGLGNIVSGLVGTSSVTSYGESLVGIVSGGKTGITALTTGCLFLLCFFFATLFTSMATYVAAPALIYVGLALVLRYKEYDRSKTLFFIFGLCIIAYVGFTFNIGNAVLFGVIIYTIMKRVIEKKKPVSYWWIMFIFAAVNILLNYVV
ncbi:MAG: NCS2 family permease [Lachnospiraceae bacterium]|nr:NCS2 family permease [Lachnospiraceae bacterium]